MQTAIAYYRVSTERQGRSGLGLETQQKAVSNFLEANGFVLIDEFIEVNSGKGITITASRTHCVNVKSKVQFWI
jgi:DNA invertase Pin-like site-specific DNA recombinase